MNTTPNGSSWLETDSLSVHFGDRSALESVSLTFAPSEIVALAGPNGAGKSTLLRCLAGVLQPSHGVVRLHGDVIHRPSPDVVYVPQRTAVDWTFPSSVIDVVLMVRMRRRSRFRPYSKEDRSLAMEHLAIVGMDHLANVQISQLSGGQQQRVFLARALLADGSIYLLDEPFTGIDAPTQELISGLLGQLCQSGKTVISATHDLEQAAATSDRIILVNRTVVAAGPPDEVLTAANLGAAYGGHFSALARLAGKDAA
ncbi:MAG: metal ABC transporter ATP-binding protein [Thermomicrobiales bacterium]|nr:metal ABC transporter ATP-binding protein [Thermomicrobiales bacterium]